MQLGIQIQTESIRFMFFIEVSDVPALRVLGVATLKTLAQASVTLTGCRAIIVYNKSPAEMTEMTERLRAVRSKDFRSFRSFRGTKILFRGKASRMV